jgi:hypothetical protein
VLNRHCALAGGRHSVFLRNVSRDLSKLRVFSQRGRSMSGALRSLWTMGVSEVSRRLVMVLELEACELGQISCPPEVPWFLH